MGHRYLAPKTLDSPKPSVSVYVNETSIIYLTAEVNGIENVLKGEPKGLVEINFISATHTVQAVIGFVQ